MTEEAKKIYLNPKLALLAKEHGFNRKCIAMFSISDDEEDGDEWELNQFGDYNFPNKIYTELWNDFNNTDKYTMSAPMYQQIVDWFREEHGISVSVNPSFKLPDWERDGKWAGNVEEVATMKTYGLKKEDSYWEAFDAAIEKAFNQIKKWKLKQ